MLSITQASEILKNLLNAKLCETDRLAENGGVRLTVCWEISRLDELKWMKTDNGGAFVDYFREVLKPLGDLLKLTQDPEIKRLEEHIKDLQAQLASQEKLHDQWFEGFRKDNGRLENEYKAYKEAVRDIKACSRP